MVEKVKRDGKVFGLCGMKSTRIVNPYENSPTMNKRVRNAAALKVDAPRSWEDAEGQVREWEQMSCFTMTDSLDDVTWTESSDLSEPKTQRLTILWDLESPTFEAELGALRYLTKREQEHKETGPTTQSLNTFKMILDFQGAQVTRTNLMPKLLQKFDSFNSDHQRAYSALKGIKNHLFLINGCPGSGKTEWNMIVAAMIQATQRTGSCRPVPRILYIVDINKTVDDAAARYHRLCQEVGVSSLAVRMHGWPSEMRSSTRLNVDKDNNKEKEKGFGDITMKFLVTGDLSRTGKRNTDAVPTLDEAAVVLGLTDIVFTTPVPAAGHFADVFRPEVIFVDEAPHARELTTLITIAYYSPRVWIFTGDVKQTLPFVKGGERHDAARDGLQFNRFAEQLKMSTMARAEQVDALDARLLVNKRAYGNLHLLPSKLFYGEEMISDHAPEDMYPASVWNLKEFLQDLNNEMTQDVSQNRIIARLKMSQQCTQRSSFWNPEHQRWVIELVEKLLNLPGLMSIDCPDRPGTIMIMTPYSAAVRKYDAIVRKWPFEWQKRVQVLTVDKAQGRQADVVVLDMVRTDRPGFMTSEHRLNVAITRARQAEIVVMHPAMAMGRRTALTRLWDCVKAGNRVFEI
ncbi:uncharacterized protein J7T54_007516 [Emericellopsis cladophorae]|uniref:DNA2/NAM7 helicase-like C-terminal domain-containing protein n=1 Tax=Emericellopsis cladophorae TaxID=2686198 RepID=A0A9P9XYH1_9HYPO|nr:uncharacterized protein J7T54_007516 [Emericellopsis cladophorae]KAI6780040.1 hypothetical protein J7T54_007516 [Emericellopsis cladophorae]